MRWRADSTMGQDRHTIRVAVLLGTVAVIGVACSGTSEGGVEAAQERVTAAEQSVDNAEAALEQAGSEFCAQAKDYIIAIDRYGKLFGDSEATVGDVRTLGADLVDPRESTASAAQAVLDAHDALNAANQELADARAALESAQASARSASSTAPPSTPKAAPSSSPQVPTASVDRVNQAEMDLEAATEGITDQTPLTQAAETFTSAAFALEMSWLNLFADAGCLTDEQSKEAAAAVRDYTVALQTSLVAAGYYEGKIDGVYGPETVKAVENLQKDARLPVTGLVDQATSQALDDAVARESGSAAAESMIHATSVQTTLKLAGYWPGPIDGEWTPELTEALKEFQRDLGVEPTGAVDAATLAALEEALSVQPAASPSPTAEPTTSPSGSG
jgi:murein L,D-transpeptidase YcbB/YkuD